MGLSMDLKGEVHFYGLTEEQKKIQPIQLTFHLGQWWRRYDLHDYVVNEFADGEDHGQETYLSEDDMRQIISAIASDEWSHADDRFSEPREYDEARKAEDINVFQRAIEWIKSGEDGEDVERFVVYRAG